jgi:cyanophycinase-like exopeptidase
MSEFEKSLIADGLKNQMKTKFVQIPTAAGQESDSRLAYWQQLGRIQADSIGASCVFLPIYTREDAYNLDYAEQIKDSSLIYLSGGDPHYLANSLINTPVWSAILSNWEKGGSLAGCSAGAMVLSSQIPHFRLSKNEPTKGLNLIPNIRVIPHFNKFFKWIPESAAKLLLNVPEDSILIGIDELTAIVKRSGETNWKVYGQAKVHFLKGIDQQQLGNGQEIKF